MTYEELYAMLDKKLGTGRYVVRHYPDESIVIGYRETLAEARQLRDASRSLNRSAIIVDTATNRIVRV